MDRQQFAERLTAHVENALVAAEASPDVRDEEPFLIELVDLIRSQPSHRSIGIESLCALVPQIATANGIVELLEYCAHTLRPPELLAAVQAHAEAARHELESGASLMPWQTARMCEQILDAAQDDWEDREMFASLGGK